jgi:hypothetical protein
VFKDNVFFSIGLLASSLFLLILTGCFSHENRFDVSKEMVVRGREFDNLQIPTSLWDAILSSYQKTERSVQGQDLDVDNGSTNIAINFYPMHLHLAEKTPGVLRTPHMRFEFPEGGGIVDLANEVQNNVRGTWYLKVEPIGLGEEVKQVKVFYLSNGRTRTIEGRTFGAGCATFMEITSFFHRQLSGDGVRVNSRDGSYISLLAGSYFFVVTKDDSLYLSQLTITDSRYPEWECPRKDETAQIPF